jgi:hypothetical protein
MSNLSKMMASIEVIPGVIKVTTRLITLIESKLVKNGVQRNYRGA